MNVELVIVSLEFMFNKVVRVFLKMVVFVVVNGFLDVKSVLIVFCRVDVGFVFRRFILRVKGRVIVIRKLIFYVFVEVVEGKEMKFFKSYKKN